MCIGVLILASTWRLLVKVLHVLLEGTPKHIDVHRLCHQIEDLEGVTLVHDVHVWTLTSGYDAMTAHVLIDPDYPGNLEDHHPGGDDARRVHREPPCAAPARRGGIAGAMPN